MPMDRLEVKVSITKLLLGLLVIIVPLSVVGLILTERSSKSFDNTIGNDFKTMAQLYSNDVSQFVSERVSEMKAIAADPTLLATVNGAKRSGTYKSLTTEPAEAAAPQPAWRVAQAAAAMNSMLGSNASQSLRSHKDLDPRILRLVAIDDAGNVVAAAQKPGALSNAHNDLWQAAMALKGQQAAKVSDILYDEFTKSYYVDVGLPIFDPASNASVGVLTAAISLNDLLSRFQTPTANGARVLLVNDSGSIVSGPNSDVFAHKKSPEFDAVRDSLGSLEGRQSGWQLASLISGPSIVAFAGTGLKQNYDKLGWFVIVTQEEHQAAAAIRGLARFAMLMVILALFMLTLLCVYYYLHRTQKFEDIEEAMPSKEKEGQGRAATAY
jgi:preprotein translocase subunit SecG